MRPSLVIAMGVIGIGMLQVNAAIGADSSKQDKGKGIVNERSTGNEPFTGPGASGGPMHSSPGATERTIQENPGSQGGMGGGEKGGSGKSDTSKKSGSSGASGGR
ncbi:MAG TPA: hypothetical protein VL329_00600 [Nitrospiraceae bacterium]|nr:hypothetical protein [Nitrospiraceae bacterium]